FNFSGLGHEHVLFHMFRSVQDVQPLISQESFPLNAECLCCQRTNPIAAPNSTPRTPALVGDPSGWPGSLSLSQKPKTGSLGTWLKTGCIALLTWIDSEKQAKNAF